MRIINIDPGMGYFGKTSTGTYFSFVKEISPAPQIGDYLYDKLHQMADRIEGYTKNGYNLKSISVRPYLGNVPGAPHIKTVIAGRIPIDSEVLLKNTKIVGKVIKISYKERISYVCTEEKCREKACSWRFLCEL